jgi:hypothetical protein
MAKKVLPQHAADIETVVAEYAQKWETSDNVDDADAIITDKKWEETSDDDATLTDERREKANDDATLRDEALLASEIDTTLRDEELDASESDTALTGEKIVQDNQSPLSTSEASSQSMDETTCTSTQK